MSSSYLGQPREYQNTMTRRNCLCALCMAMLPPCKVQNVCGPMQNAKPNSSVQNRVLWGLQTVVGMPALLQKDQPFTMPGLFRATGQDPCCQSFLDSLLPNKYDDCQIVRIQVEPDRPVLWPRIFSSMLRCATACLPISLINTVKDKSIGQPEHNPDFAKS